MYTILVVDDEKDIVSALEIYLKAEGTASSPPIMAGRRCPWPHGRTYTLSSWTS